MKYNEYRGVTDVVIAPMTISPEGAESYGTVIPLAGVQSLDFSVSESEESHYYDNGARVVVSASGADTYNLTLSVPDPKIRALIEGVTYDETKQAYVKTKPVKKYFALGFKVGLAGDDEGLEEYTWVYKGKFSTGGVTHDTRDDGTSATNCSYTFTSIDTGTKYALTEGSHSVKKATILSTHAKAATFFDTVTTPDKITVTG